MYKMAMLLGLLVAIMSVSAFGAGFMGTPTAELDQGQWSVGFNYMYSDMELDKTKMKVSGSENIKYEAENGDSGSFKESYTGSFKFDIDDVKTQRYYGTIGYGITDVWEAYVQLGIADLKAKVREADDPEDVWSGLNFDNDFAWGWGTRYTFYEQDNVRWGARLLQVDDAGGKQRGDTFRSVLMYEVGYQATATKFESKNPFSPTRANVLLFPTRYENIYTGRGYLYMPLYEGMRHVNTLKLAKAASEQANMASISTPVLAVVFTLDSITKPSFVKVNSIFLSAISVYTPIRNYIRSLWKKG